jgi:hypothetical protein
MTRMTTAFLIITCLIAVDSATAGDPGAKLVQVAGNHQKIAEPASTDRETTVSSAEPITMLTEIRAVMDSTRTAEFALREELGSAEGQEMARRLGELKRASRMRILHIQLQYAREEGRGELERRILTSIEDLQRPTAPGGPRLTGRNSPPPEAKPVVKPSGGSQSH